MQNNKYIYIVETETGERKATHLVPSGGGDRAVMERAEQMLREAQAEYPECTCYIGGEDDFAQWAAGKIYIDGQYVDRPPYIPPLADVQAAKINKLKGIRDAKELEPVAYNGSSFDFDTKSYDRINAAIIALDGGGSIGWTTADNTVVTVTAADLRGVIAAAAARSNSLHIIYRGLKERVMAATTNEEVEEIHWPEA